MVVLISVSDSSSWIECREDEVLHPDPLSQKRPFDGRRYRKILISASLFPGITRLVGAKGDSSSSGRLLGRCPRPGSRLLRALKRSPSPLRPRRLRC